MEGASNGPTDEPPPGPTLAHRALLAVVCQRHHAAVVRVGLDGRLSLAMPVTAGNRGFSPGYVMEQRS